MYKGMERALEMKKVYEILIINIVRKTKNVECLEVVKSKTLKHVLQKCLWLYWAILKKCFNDTRDYTKIVTMLWCHGNSEFIYEVSKIALNFDL